MVPTMPSSTLFGISSETNMKVLFSRVTPARAFSPRDDALEVRGYHHLRLVDWPEKLQKNVDLVPVLGRASVLEDPPRVQAKTFEGLLLTLLSGEVAFSRAVARIT
jgi:hypothetical protein